MTQTRENVENRAVSPVIGVILMVAITVILAAVIGAFVLEIGDQQETAPSSSFDIEESMTYVVDNSGGADGSLNLSVVSASHTGGDTIDVTQAEIKVEGNASVWGMPKCDDPSATGNDCKNGAVPNWGMMLTPVPNYGPTAGTNEPVEFTSGESWSIMSYNGLSDEHVKAGQILRTSNPTYHGNIDAASKASCPTGGIYLEPNGQPMDQLEQDDDIQIVWNAESGGKTQTLTKYTVQSSSTC
jgi:flagellin-like protein